MNWLNFLAARTVRVLFIGTFLLLMFIGKGSCETFPGSSNPHDALLQANQFYEKGEFEKALEIYTQLVDLGFEGSALYYNLGNVYYRKGERGKAILWYEKALRLSPRDADVVFNLSLARSHIKDDKEAMFSRMVRYFSGQELGIALFVFVWIFFGVLGARILGWIGGSWCSVTLWLAGLVLVLSSTWFAFNLTINGRPIAIVTTPPGEVRNGPGEDYAVGFTIPEGSKVLVLNRRPEWTQIGVPQQGLKGWIPTKEVEFIARPVL